MRAFFSEVPSLNKHFRNLSIRFTLRDDSLEGTPLLLPRRNTGVAAIVVGIMFVIFAAVLVSQAGRLNLHTLGSVFDLMSMLFSLFWLIGWSVGVLLLGALTLLLLFFRESAWLAGGQLNHAVIAGPFRMIAGYDLARMCNLDVEVDTSGEQARVRFEYDDLRRTLGDLMPRGTAERNAQILRDAMDVVVKTPPVAEFAPQPEFTPQSKFEPPVEIMQRRLPMTSMLALVAANMLPLLGVLLGGWTLAEMMVLFWAESAVIGFYNLFKIAVVAKWWAPFPALFFTGHFGGFMSLHFLFIYEIFVRGMGAEYPAPGVVDALTPLLTHLWPALLALFVSHGVSFAMNFIARGEYKRAKVASLMSAPYVRIVVMQFTIIFGGWVVMLLQNPLPALVLLIVLKVIADLHAHYGERKNNWN